MSRRCRHQLADLAHGSLDADGCLVCPWHGSRYDVRNGQMVSGPRGFLAYHGPTPGYTQFVRPTAGSCGCAPDGCCAAAAQITVE